MLSIVTVSRNDDHGGNLLYRLQTYIDCLTEYRQLLNWNLELVIVEWNPPEDTSSLGKVLRIPPGLSVRIITVPSIIHQRFENWEILPIFLGVAYNAGIRKAKGEWVLTTTQDLVFSERLARFLANENLCGQTFYRVSRHDITESEVLGDNIEEKVNYCAGHVWRIREYHPEQLLHTHAAGDFILMHCDAWNNLRGYPEWPVLGTYLDGLVLHSAYALGLRQISFDHSRCIYHIAHEDQGVDGRHKILPNIDYGTMYKQLCYSILSNTQPLKVNGEAWGLADCETTISSPISSQVLDNGKLSRGLPMP